MVADADRLGADVLGYRMTPSADYLSTVPVSGQSEVKALLGSSPPDISGVVGTVPLATAVGDSMSCTAGSAW